jgi:CheY-like chemotaxis protein
MKKILLVDDSRTSLFMEQMILKRGAYSVVTGVSGPEAVAKARSERRVTDIRPCAAAVFTAGPR